MQKIYVRNGGVLIDQPLDDGSLSLKKKSKLPKRRMRHRAERPVRARERAAGLSHKKELLEPLRESLRHGVTLAGPGTEHTADELAAALFDELPRMATQWAEVERQIEDAGAEFAALTDDRDTVKAELERFIELRDRLGVALVEGRARILIVVPEGHEIREWRGPRPSDPARYNGRMYRVMAER